MVYTVRKQQKSRSAKRQARRVAGWYGWKNESEAQRVLPNGEIQIEAGRRTRRRGSSTMTENV